MTQLNEGSSENSTKASDAQDKTMEQRSDRLQDSTWDAVSTKHIIETDIAVCRRLLEEVHLTNDSQELGRRFDGIEFVGYGAFGVVHKARDIQLDRDVAIKMLRPSKSESRNLRRRFMREARAAASLEHPGIVRVLDVGRCEEIPFIVSAFVPGIDLARWFVQRDRHLLPNEAATIVREVAEAVHFAHTRGVLHRDIKPGNVLLRAVEPTTESPWPWKPELTDFGLAKRIDDETSGDNDLTVDGAIQGTVRYMSPEQAMGRSQDIGIASDLFSLGVILYELLTGRVPFQGDTEEAIRFNVASQEPPRPRSIASGIPKDLEAIVMKCLEKNPEDRFASAKDLVDDLSRFLEGRPVRARSLGAFQRVAYWMKRNPRQAVLGSLSLCIIGSAVAVAGVAKWRESIESRRATNNWRQMLLATNNMYEHVAEKLFGGSPISNDELLDILLQSLDLHREYAIQSGHDEHSRHRLSVAHHYASLGFGKLGKYGEALRHRKACMEILQGLITEHPESERYRYDHFHSQLFVGNLLQWAGESVDLVAQMRLCKEELDALLKVAPDNPIYMEAMVTTKIKIAWELLSRHDDEWRSYCLHARDISIKLSEQFPDNPVYCKGAIMAWGLLVYESMETRQWDRALEYSQEGKRFYERTLKSHEEEGWVLECSKLLYLNHCRVLFLSERWHEFLASCDEVSDRLQRQAAIIGSDLATETERLEFLLQKGIALRKIAETEKADLCFRQVAVEIELMSVYPMVTQAVQSLEQKYDISLTSRPSN